MCLVAVPVMGFSFYLILQSGAGNDGVLGKEAYEAAANVADETLSSMPTVASFGGECKAAERYESHLGKAEEAAIRQVGFHLILLFATQLCRCCAVSAQEFNDRFYSTLAAAQSKTLGLGTGVLWGSFFGMMAIGMWWGGRLITQSQEQALIDNPIPSDFYTSDTYAVNRLVADQYCYYTPPGSFGSGRTVAYTGDAYEACVCNYIPWSTVIVNAPGAVDVQCGCSKGEFSIASDCITVGRTIAVFFSVMIAGFLVSF